jgi:DNA-binding transcriptional LysR family regulator
MEMHQVRYFLAAARTLSFTRAAETCSVSQPALTTAIKKLETRLRAPLFHREGNRVVLTEVGRRLQPYFAAIVEQTEAVENVARDLRVLNQVPVRLGVMSTVGPVRIAALLAEFEARCPGVEVAVRDGAPEALAALLDGDELDAAILNAVDGLSESVRVEPLYTERYVVILPDDHPLKDSNGIALRDLSGLPYVDRLSCEMREMVMGVCAESGVTLYARFRSEREDWVQAMVAANIGFAFMPEYSVTDRDMLRRPLVDPALTRTISLVTQRGRLYTPGLAAFIETTRSQRWATPREFITLGERSTLAQGP